MIHNPPKSPAAREVTAHYRALLLCSTAEPHTSSRPCDRCVKAAKRQLDLAADVARVRQTEMSA